MPAVWLIDAYRAGERAQVRALVDALGWPCEEKQLSYRKFELRTNLFRGSDLHGIDPGNSSSLQPPWPDLLISSGMRNEPVCRWVRRQSGGKSKIVHLGRPWADPSRFDLVITTPQYRVAAGENVLLNALTLHQVTPQRLQAAAGDWREKFAHLASPLTAVVVGGDSGPYTLGPKAAVRLARQVNARLATTGGSVLVTTSSRTRPEVADILAAELTIPHELYRWRAADTGNPYFGLLALADEFVVTADSIAMLSEACATQKPVWMFDLGGMRETQTDRDFRLGGVLYGALMRWVWKKLSRDINLVHRDLVASGRAQWLGETRREITRDSAVQHETDLTRAVARVRALFADGEASINSGDASFDRGDASP